MFEKSTNKFGILQVACLLLIVFGLSCLFSFSVFASESNDGYVLDDCAKKLDDSLPANSLSFSESKMQDEASLSGSTQDTNIINSINSNASGMSSTYAIKTYVDATTGHISIPDNIVLTNNETENKIKFRGIELFAKSGYEKLDGNWEVKLEDGTQLFYGEIGKSITFSTPVVIEPSSKLNLKVTWDKSGIFEKRYIGAMPYKFVFYYDVPVLEPYANYFETDEDNIITFYFDDERYDRSGKTYSMPTSTTQDRKWMTENYDTVTKIIVDETYHEYAPTEFNYWFGVDAKVGTISNLKYIDLRNLNTSNCINFSYMFEMCVNVESFVGLDSMDTSHGENFNGMFMNVNVDYLDISHFDMSKALYCGAMFANTSGNSMPDLSGWDMSNVETLYQTFLLSTVRDFSGISNWTLEKATNTASMFSCCYYATVAPDLSSWKGTSTIQCEGMFINFGSQNGGALFSIRLDSMTFEKCEYCYRMFENCPYLEAIYCNCNLKQDAPLLVQKYTTSMFYDCINLSPLISVSGTPTDWTYAYPKSESNPDGFFTAC